MEWLSQIWPFVPGQQHLIFRIAGLSIIGLIALNLISALRQGLPVGSVLSGLFVQVPTSNAIERRIRFVLIAFSLVCFLVVVLDIQINGMQLIDPSWARGR